jgi:hypothetical protein
MRWETSLLAVTGLRLSTNLPIATAGASDGGRSTHEADV